MRDEAKTGGALSAYASLGAWAGGFAGLYLALADFGAGWLWQPWWRDRVELFFRLVALEPALLAALGAIVGVAVAVVHRRIARPWSRSVALAGLAMPGLVWLAMKLFEGGTMSRLSARPALIAVTAVVLFAFASIAVRASYAIIAQGESSSRRRLWIALGLLGLSFVLSKVDEIVLPKLYDYLHGTLTLVAGATAALGGIVGARPALSRLADRRSTTLVAAAAAAVVAFVDVATLEASPNVRVALFDARSPHSRSLLQAWGALGGASGRRVASAQSIARARLARETRRQSFAPGELPVLESPHVLLVTIDALRADHLGVHGYERALSPNIDRLAAEATVFEHAYAVAPHSSYSLSSLMTSEYLHETVELGLPSPETTLASTFAEAGYHTAAFYTLGIFHTEGERLALYEQNAFRFARHDHQTYRAEPLTDAVLDEVDRVVEDGERPTFFWAHYFDVHEPYLDTSLGTADIDRYDAEIRNVDRALGRLLAEMERRLGRPVVVVLTADHGEEFRDHGGVYHGSTLYEEQIRVPLIVRIPGVEPRRVPAPVDLVDVAPTLLALAGLAPPATMRGDDLRPLASGAAESLGPVFAAVTTKRMVVRWPIKLVADLRFGLFELYDLEHDPDERENLAASNPALLEEMRGEAYAWLDSLQPAETDPRRLAIDRGRLGDRRAVPTLVETIADESALPDLRADAARILGRLADPASASALLSAMTSPDVMVAAEAAIALGRLQDARAHDALEQLVHAEDPDLRTRAAVSLARLRDTDAVPALIEALYVATEKYEREEAVRWLGRLRDPRAIDPLVQLLPEFRVRYLTVIALGQLGDPRAFDPLFDMLDWEHHASTRDSVIRALGLLGNPTATDALVRITANEAELKSAPESLVRLGALATGAIGGVDLVRSEARHGFRACVAGPLLHDWDYVGRTTCEVSRSTATLTLSVPAAVERAERGVVAIFRTRRATTGPAVDARLRIGAHALPPIAIDATWQEHRALLPPGSLRGPRVPAVLEVSDPRARIVVDHLLLVPLQAAHEA